MSLAQAPRTKQHQKKNVAESGSAAVARQQRAWCRDMALPQRACRRRPARRECCPVATASVVGQRV